MCFGACLNARLKKVVYGVDLNESGAVMLKDRLPALYKTDHYSTEFIGGVLAEECAHVFREGEAEVLRIREQFAKSE
jgi:tRNA(Arg) A34 adenosine deaminase TadA